MKKCLGLFELDYNYTVRIKSAKYLIGIRYFISLH